MRRRLGPIVIEGKGRGAVFDEICGEWSVLEPADSEEPHIRFRFVESVDVPKKGVYVGSWRLGPGWVAGTDGGLDYLIFSSGAAGFDVEVAPRRPTRGALGAVSKIWHWNYLDPAQRLAKNFMYGVFDTVSAVALLEHGATYLHAGSFSVDSRGIAIIAWGGVGKTTSVLKFIAERSGRYLSDDLGLVSADSTLWRTPKKLQIYAYNVDGQPALRRRLLEGRGLFDRANWHWRRRRFGPRKVRRRIKAESLFRSHQVGVSAPLEEVIFLERADVSSPHAVAIEARDLARRSAAILVDELGVLFSLCVAAESHGIDIGIPFLAALRRRMQQVMVEAFSGRTLHRLQVPVGAGPEEVVEAVAMMR